MVKLRQEQRPAQKANWIEHFYAGELRVTNGETETDNIEWINQLKYRGFVEVGAEPTPEPPQQEPHEGDTEVIEETIHNDEPFEPLGTQTVDEDTEIPSEIGEAYHQDSSPIEEDGENPSEEDVAAAQEPPANVDLDPSPTEEDAEGDSTEVERPSRKRRRSTATKETD